MRRCWVWQRVVSLPGQACEVVDPGRPLLVSDRVPEQVCERAVEGSTDDLGIRLAFDTQVPIPVRPLLGYERPAVEERVPSQRVRM